MARGHDSPSGSLAPASGAPGAAAAEPLDPLSDVFRAVRLTGALFFRIEAASPWRVGVPQAQLVRPAILPSTQHLVSYHVVTAGACWAGLPEGANTRLEAGDVLVVPHGHPYLLTTEKGAGGDTPAEEVLPFFQALAGRRLLGTVREGGDGPERVSVVCGFLGCDLLPFNPVLAALPPLVHLRPPEDAAGDRLGHLVGLALAESDEDRAGRDSVLLRLSELLFIELVRRYLALLPAEQTGWLAAARDEAVGRALTLMHARPGHPWTLEDLAREAGLSRSVLAERFSHFLGQPPMQYLARWRMQVAARLLAEGTAKVAAVALEVGYDSEAAFSRAFKRTVGVSPAAWRGHRT